MMQPVSCNEPEADFEPEAVVERHVELAADPSAVWDELPAMLGDDVELEPEPGGRLHVREPEGELVGVVHEAVPGERLAFRWVRLEGDDPPSDVEITLEPNGVGTILHLRETRLDGARLVRSALLASARA
jgi:uncharacterized protein YndB with AHSA1/START domain